MARKNNDTYTAEITHIGIPEEVVDERTGEVLIRLTEQKTIRSVEVSKDFIDLRVPRKPKFNNGPFMTIFQNPLLSILKENDLSKNEMKLLLYLIASCNVRNSINTDLKQLEQDLKMARSNVSTALRGLVERNIVIKRDGERYGKTPLPFELHLGFDQINYSLGYNGSAKHFHEDKSNHPQLMQKDGETPLLIEEKKLIADKKEKNPAKPKKGKNILPTLNDVFFNKKFADYDVNKKPSVFTAEQFKELIDRKLKGEDVPELDGIILDTKAKR